MNYGAIGSILGHELTHGFDDSGRHYDKNGNMVQWWTNQTINEYVNRTKCFVEQYNSFIVPEIDEKVRYSKQKRALFRDNPLIVNLQINGERTLGENIADNGGIREAFLAYKMYTKMFGREQTLPGFEDFTAEQLFFLSFGNVSESQEELLCTRINFHYPPTQSNSCGAKQRRLLDCVSPSKTSTALDGFALREF